MAFTFLLTLSSWCAMHMLFHVYAVYMRMYSPPCSLAPDHSVQQYCILVLNFPPSAHPCVESMKYGGKTHEQLSKIMVEVSVHLPQPCNWVLRGVPSECLGTGLHRPLLSSALCTVHPVMSRFQAMPCTWLFMMKRLRNICKVHVYMHVHSVRTVHVDMGYYACT